MSRIASVAHPRAARRFILLREEGDAVWSRGVRIRRYQLTSLGYAAPGGHRRDATGSLRAVDPSIARP
jgi:hypothetical protein